MDEVQRRGSPARLSYKRRFLSFILCAVLVAGMMEPPPAKAVVVEGAIAASAGVAAAPALSVLCTLLLTAVGVDFASGVFGGTEVFGSAAYDVGAKLGKAAREVGGVVWEWFDAQSAAITDAGGFTADWKTTVPKEVAEFARQWVLSQYFSDASELSLGQSGFHIQHYLSSDSANMVDIVVPLSPYVTDDFAPVGIIYPNIEELDKGQRIYNFFGTATTFKVTLSTYNTQYRTRWYLSNSIVESLTGKTIQDCFLGLVFGYDSAAGYYRFGFYNPSAKSVSWAVDKSLPSLALITATGTAIANEELTKEKDKDMTILCPPPYAWANVGGLTVPVVKELTWDKVRDDAGAVEKPDVGTGEAVGDIALEDIQKQEKTLGAVFASKFPFCIPWDIAKAVQLLAAPPKTPYWEVDFYGVLDGQYGIDWQGDTAIVIDISEFEFLGQVCRWTSTFMFVWALMLGTKRLIWTG